MRLRAPTAILAAVASVVLVLGGAPAANAATYPVPYSFTAHAVLAGAHPDADPPGANNWSCHRSAAHPEPIVLVHGTGGNKNTNWQTYAPLLANNGYCVFALTYGVLPGAGLPLNQVGGLGRIENSAAQLGAFVDRVLAATGASKVDIVGHSQGTFMPNYYAKFLGGANKIDKYVSLAPLWHGTNTAGAATLREVALAFGVKVPVDEWAAGGEMITGSNFVNRMRAGGVAQPGITYTNIATKYDELVTPYTSGIESGMTNIVLQNQCPRDFTDHLEIVADPNATIDVLNALDPAHPRPLTCRLVLPFL